MRYNFLFFLPAFFFLPVSGTESIDGRRTNYASSGRLSETFASGASVGFLSPVSRGGYTLTARDDFNGKKLDTTFWDYIYENKIRGFGKMLRSNVVVSDGTLKLYARKTYGSESNISFSAGMISSQYRLNQKYGYFEVRASLTEQLGPHCAFWLLQHSVGISTGLPNPSLYGTEIDIFEYHRVQGIDRLYFNLHWNGYNFSNGSHQTTGTAVDIPGISKGFHVFGLEWTPEAYIYYVDGVERFRTGIAISHVPEFILLSTEINGFGGDRFQMGNVPDIFEVDYVAVYARKPSVTVYSDCDFYGRVSAPLLQGNYTSDQLSALGVEDNTASSIEIPPGWKVIAYGEDHFKGDSIIVSGDARCSAAFNDKLSSLRVMNHK